MGRWTHRIVLAAALLAALCANVGTLNAQGLTGQISGVVTDTGGGVMPGATVTVKNVGTNLVREAVTGADGRFVITNLLAGTFDLTVTVAGLQALRAERHRARRHRALALRAIALEDRRPVGNGHGPVRDRQGADDERRAIGDDHRQPDRGHRPARPRLHGQPQDAARRHRHVRARRPGLGLGRRHVDQRSDVVQLLLRRRHQQGHRLELGQLRRAGARFDRRSEGAGVELPGRVRPQLGRDDHRRHQERHA